MSGSGADGVASGAPLLSISWIASLGLSPAGLPLVALRSKSTVESLGIGPTVTAPELSMTTGVSSIHSAVAYDDEYGVLWLNV